MTNINPFVSNLINQGVLKTPRIIEAFKKIDRANFVLPENHDNAYIDAPLPIGERQTISQPYTVAFMIELLQPKSGDKIFEIGFGSGWQTAILAHIVSQESQISNLKSQKLGKIFAVERIEKLFKFGTKNISTYSFIEKGIVKTILGDATMGLKKYAPFDKIIAAASAQEIPEEWLTELKIGGRLVMPIRNSIWLYIKKSPQEFDEQEFPGFVFVSLVTNKK